MSIEQVRRRSRRECAEAIKEIIEALTANRTNYSAAEAVCRDAAEEGGFAEEVWREPLEAAEEERAREEEDRAEIAEVVRVREEAKARAKAEPDPEPAAMLPEPEAVGPSPREEAWGEFLSRAERGLERGESLEVWEAKAGEEGWVLPDGLAPFFYPAAQPEDAVEGAAQPEAVEAEEADTDEEEEELSPEDEAQARALLANINLGKSLLPHDGSAVALDPRGLDTISAEQVMKVRALNSLHAVINDVGGKTVIASVQQSREGGRKAIVFQSERSFRLRYRNQTVQIRGAKPQELGEFWLNSPNRRQFEGVTFAPAAGMVVDGCLNLWQGWGVEAQAGDWSLMQEHIRVVLANGDEEMANYITWWIAWAFQHPDRQAEVALVLIGEKGAGKGTLARWLEKIFGAHCFQVTGQEQVIGRFNGHLQDCVLFVADEAYWGGDKRCVGRLQGMITEPRIPIERKGVDAYEVANFLHVVMLAEPGWVIPAGRFERRYAVALVSKARRGDRGYFQALHREMEAGGAAAMFHDLRALDLGDWHPREVPATSALRKQQEQNLPPLEQWLEGLLHNGLLPKPFLGKPNTSLTRSLLEDARYKVPRLRDLSENGLRNFLIDADKIGEACTKYRKSTANGWTFPPLREARAAWEKLYGPKAWDNADLKDWLPGWHDGVPVVGR
jgi:hypothetical protein